jgi:hypothetical protein
MFVLWKILKNQNKLIENKKFPHFQEIIYSVIKKNHLYKNIYSLKYNK